MSALCFSEKQISIRKCSEERWSGGKQKVRDAEDQLPAFPPLNSIVCVDFGSGQPDLSSQTQKSGYTLVL